MIRDSKRSITNEIAQFLDLLDGVCVKRHQVVTKTMRNMRLVRNDNRTARDHGRQFSEHGVGSKCRNVSDDEKKLLGHLKGRDERGSKCRNMSDDEKKLLENLKGRVERIGKLSREIDNEEENAQMEGYKHVDYDEEDDNDIVGNSSNHHMENRGLVKKHLLHPNGKKRVSFVEDGNVVRVYDIDENTSPDIDEVEDSTKGIQDEDEDEAWNHVHRSM